MNPLDTTKRQVLYSTGQLRDCCLRSSFDFPQIPEHCSPTKYARIELSHTGCSNVVLPSHSPNVSLIRLRSCSHDKLHSHVDEKRVRERVQVRCSDLVGSDLPHPLIDVRQIAASVKVRGLCDELLEES